MFRPSFRGSTHEKEQKDKFLSFTSQKVVDDAIFVAHYHKDSFHAGYPLHKHDYFEVLFFISGHVDYEVNNRVYSLQHHHSFAALALM